MGKAAVPPCQAALKCDGQSAFCPVSDNHVDVDAVCDDGNKCTTDDKCQADGKCIGTPTGDCVCTSDSDCELDQNPCTLEVCKEGRCVGFGNAVAGTQCTGSSSSTSGGSNYLYTDSCQPPFACNSLGECNPVLDCPRDASGTLPCSGRGL